MKQHIKDYIHDTNLSLKRTIKQSLNDKDLMLKEKYNHGEMGVKEFHLARKRNKIDLRSAAKQVQKNIYTAMTWRRGGSRWAPLASALRDRFVEE